MKKTLSLVKDSLLCTIICVLLIIFNAVALISTTLSTLLIIVFMGCYFQNKTIIRPILSGIVIFLISFLFINPINIFIFILPGVVLGVFAGLFLKNVKNVKIFYFISTIIFFIVNLATELAFAKYIMNMDFITYIMSDLPVGFPEAIAKNTRLFLVSFILAMVVMSFLQVVILNKSNQIYKKRIMKLIGEKEIETTN